jgi:hypothetical protein
MESRYTRGPWDFEWSGSFLNGMTVHETLRIFMNECTVLDYIRHGAELRATRIAELGDVTLFASMM